MAKDASDIDIIRGSLHEILESGGTVETVCRALAAEIEEMKGDKQEKSRAIYYLGVAAGCADKGKVRP